MAKTQKQLLDLLKKPYAFLEAYGTERAEQLIIERAEDNAEDNITAGGLIVCDYGNIIEFVEEECLNKPFEGITLTEVYSVGGGEGGGDSVVRVWAVTVDGEVKAHIRATGFYESYSGTEYNDEAELVEAHEVIETKYFTAAERKAAKTTKFV
jgi:hypothetical protein